MTKDLPFHICDPEIVAGDFFLYVLKREALRRNLNYVLNTAQGDRTFFFITIGPDELKDWNCWAAERREKYAV